METEYWCYKCALANGKTKIGWEDEIDIHLNYCSGCNVYGFVITCYNKEV